MRRTFVLPAFLAGAIASCATLQQFAALRSVDFQLDRVADVQVAGISPSVLSRRDRVVWSGMGISTPSLSASDRKKPSVKRSGRWKGHHYNDALKSGAMHQSRKGIGVSEQTYYRWRREAQRWSCPFRRESVKIQPISNPKLVV
jgi:hypothetical protein